jgi:hypothetical protein
VTVPDGTTTCVNAPPGKLKEAMRCLKRRLSDAVYRCLPHDVKLSRRRAREDTRGAATDSSAAGSTPTTGSSDKSLPGPASTDPTNPDEDRLD